MSKPVVFVMNTLPHFVSFSNSGTGIMALLVYFCVGISLTPSCVSFTPYLFVLETRRAPVDAPFDINFSDSFPSI